jgi:SAM-dependent methyltransferase
MRKLDNASVVSTLAFHRDLLGDHERTDAYRRAIEAVVRPGDVVVDLGCGSGILSFFACRAGARRVYAIDELPVIELARTLARANGIEERIVFINKSSYDAVIDEPVDVLVTETMGNNGFDERIAGAVAHARHAWLREGATIIPSSVEMIGAPVELPKLHDVAQFWRERPYGFDFAPLAGFAMNAFHAIDVAPEHLLAGGQTLGRLVLGEGSAVRGGAEFVMERDAEMHGAGVWFHAQLAPGIDVTNEPPNPCRSWRHSLFPIAEPQHVRRDESVRVDIQTWDGIEWRWRVGGGEGATFYGFPLLC